MNLTEGLLARPGCDIHTWTGGPSDAPLVVFTHGATIDHHEWDATLPLVGEHFRVLAWDVRGHGLSRPAPFALGAAIDDLLGILDALQVEQAVFVGHSMGGNLHQELVFRHPERVRAMAFLGCTWNFQKLTRPETLLLSMARPMFMAYPYRMLVEQAVKISAITPAGQEALRRSMQATSKAEWVQVMMATMECLHYEPGYRIGKPLLLMVGDQERTGNIRKAMPAWAAQEPDCRFMVIPAAGHAANLDNPGVFHEMLLDFLMTRCR